MAKHLLYSVYNNMRARCNNKKHWLFHRYGGRGIIVCDRWLGRGGFKNFLKDMGERPAGYQLDRIDNDGNYEPKNCRWASILEQMNNRSNRKEFRGKTFTEWSKELGIKRSTLAQ